MTLDDLTVANTKGNQFPYATEVEDDWSPAVESGADCDSVATWKMRHLVSNGWPITSLRLACCFVEPRAANEKRNRYHLVLLADLDGTTYVLDNRHPYPVEYDMLPYEWHKIQIAGTQQWEWAQGADKTIS